MKHERTWCSGCGVSSAYEPKSWILCECTVPLLDGSKTEWERYLSNMRPVESKDQLTLEEYIDVLFSFDATLSVWQKLSLLHEELTILRTENRMLKEKE